MCVIGSLFDYSGSFRKTRVKVAWEEPELTQAAVPLPVSSALIQGVNCIVVMTTLPKE